MAFRLFDDAFVSIDGVDYSDHVQAAGLDYSAEPQDITAMGNGTRIRRGGLKDWSASITFFADEAAAMVSNALFAKVGTTVALIMRPDKSEGVSATNPNFTGTGLLETLPLMGGTVGEMQMTTPTISAAGTLSRATS